MKYYTLLAVLLLLGAGCLQVNPDKDWMVFYYPDGQMSDEDRWIIRPGFSSFQECYGWAYDYALEHNLSGEDLFECGTGCEFDSTFQLYICDETLDDDLPLSSSIEPAQQESSVKIINSGGNAITYQTYEEFGASVKVSFPEYNNVPNRDLGIRMIQVYPDLCQFVVECQ